jgi:hypothetical protein
MKKLFIFSLAVLLITAFSVPASAFENEFGGSWRTRFYMQKQFSGSSEGAADEAQDLSQVDTRTRLDYTAKINDNLKLVNEFEMDAVWGQSDDMVATTGGTTISLKNSYGNIKTDGVAFEIKNTYADFNLFGSLVNMKIGAQPGVIARGFIFDEDFAGLTATVNASPTITVPIIWMKQTEGGIGPDANDDDVDYLAIAPVFSVSDALSINPHITYDTSESADRDVFYLGVDLDASIGAASLWFTGIYQFGALNSTLDYAAYLAAIGGDFDMGNMGIRGEIFYATGDDDVTDNDVEIFVGLQGQSYYWAEIMGKGTIDNQVSNNSPGDAITNMMAANLGATIALSDTMTLDADVWYAQLAEDNAAGDDKLGTEVDLNLGIALLEGLDLDVIAAYLFADDVTVGGASEDFEENPYEIGTKLSLKF